MWADKRYGQAFENSAMKVALLSMDVNRALISSHKRELRSDRHGRKIEKAQ